MTLKEIYQNLAMPAQWKTRQAWQQKTWLSRAAFHRHLAAPTAEDYKFFAELWGVDLETLMQDVPGFTSGRPRRSALTLATIATENLQFVEV